jgi:hypothetical protein
VSTSADALADDPVIAPLSLLDPTTRALADAYAVGEGRTPLVIGTCAEGGHRVSVAWWVGADNTVPVEDLDTLTDLVNSWDGRSANAERWINALTETRAAATEIVMAGVARADQLRGEGRRRRRGAARRRLQPELGRYLVAHGEGTYDLRGLICRLMLGAGQEASRIQRAFELLGGYPDWSPHDIEDLDCFDQELTEHRRNSRLSGMEVDAALADPRWAEADHP